MAAFNIVDWEDPDPGEVLQLAADADWTRLRERYGGLNPMPLGRCLEVARANGASTVVVETRYVDLDYRSEYSAFYSGTFQSPPNTARRLHFFQRKLEADKLWDLPDDHGYLGYVVIRPSALGTVGRTMLVPPPGLKDAVRTQVTEQITFFGQCLSVTAVPFVQQDTQLGRCAHAAAWVCHYSAHRRGEVGRRTMAAFSLLADPSLGYGRPLPSGGLTVQQLLELLRVFELPPILYGVSQLPPTPNVPWAKPDPTPPANDPDAHPGLWDTRIIPICCRYLNSGYPILVATLDHAFVLCGYQRVPRPGQGDWIQFVRNDDQRGPYLTVDDVLHDVSADGYQYSPWEALIVPLPDKLWLSPEPAEHTGGVFMQAAAKTWSSKFPDSKALLDLIDARQLALRTYATTANRFKAELDRRQLDTRLILEYRFARFSRLIWVVEAIDRRLRAQGDPAVIGEAILDATSSDHDPQPLAIHVPGVVWVHRTKGPARGPVACAPAAYHSGGVGLP